MATYRNIHLTFWTDSKVADDFTPEDRYFYLYLFTNPHTNLCGCYEISFKQMVTELGYSRDTIENLIKRFENVHNVIRYSQSAKEILLLNWYKYNWTKSEKFRKPLHAEILAIKTKKFREYLLSAYCGYGIDTNCMDTTDTDTVTVSDTVSVPVSASAREEEKHSYGRFDNVYLTDAEYQKLKDGHADYQDMIERLSEYIASKGKRYKSHYATILAWYRKDAETAKSSYKSQQFSADEQRIASWAERRQKP